MDDEDDDQCGKIDLSGKVSNSEGTKSPLSGVVTSMVWRMSLIIVGFNRLYLKIYGTVVVMKNDYFWRL